MGIPDHLTCLLKNWYACQEQQLEPEVEQWTGSNLGKEYVKAEYCHPTYVVYMQSTSREMLGWMKHKLESRLLGEISITSATLMAEIEEELKSLLMKVKEESEKVSLKLNSQRRKWQLTPVFLPGESQGWGSRVGAVYGVP